MKTKSKMDQLNKPDIHNFHFVAHAQLNTAQPFLKIQTRHASGLLSILATRRWNELSLIVQTVESLASFI